MNNTKTASVREIIEKLTEYEKEHGTGCSVTSIGSVCSADRTTEYIFNLQDRDGKETKIEISSIRQSDLIKK